MAKLDLVLKTERGEFEDERGVKRSYDIYYVEVYGGIKCKLKPADGTAKQILDVMFKSE